MLRRVLFAEACSGKELREPNPPSVFEICVNGVWVGSMNQAVSLFQSWPADRTREGRASTVCVCKREKEREREREMEREMEGNGETEG